MESLVSIGVGAAFLVSLYELLQGGTRVYFDSMTVVIAFVLLGKWMESQAKRSTKSSLKRLIKALPKRGRKRLGDGSIAFISLKEVHPGDHLQVLLGEKIPLDGVVIEGEGAADESLITGESMPVVKGVGSPVLAGTLLQQGQVVFQATKPYEETALHAMVDLVGREMSEKISSIPLVDRIIPWFVPFVIAIACLTGLFVFFQGSQEGSFSAAETAFLRALTVLLISCPCAIGIALPLAESYLIQALSEKGVLIRNRGCLSSLGRETCFVFDKTGTLTEGVFRVLNGMERLSDQDKADLKGLASYSRHPISWAIYQALGGPSSVFETAEEKVGKGIKGLSAGGTFLLGSRHFLEQEGVEVAQVLNEKCVTTSLYSEVYFSKNGKDVCVLLLGDQIRQDSHALMTALSAYKRVILSGDSLSSVAACANLCEVTEFIAGADPMQKRQAILELKKEGYLICMVGDGVNDAPALTNADVAISVFSAADISVEVSDVLMTREQLMVLPLMRKMALFTRKIMRQNLFWAFFYNVLGIGLAACGILSPIFAAFAMTCSSSIVLFNSRRIFNSTLPV